MPPSTAAARYLANAKGQLRRVRHPPHLPCLMAEAHCANGALLVASGQCQELSSEVIDALARLTRAALGVQPLMQGPDVYLTAIIARSAHLMHVVEREFDVPHIARVILERCEGYHRILCGQHVWIWTSPARDLLFVRCFGEQEITPPLGAINIV